MMFTITFRYGNGTFDSVYKEFDTFEGADYWGEKEKVKRGATQYWVR